METRPECKWHEDMTEVEYKSMKKDKCKQPPPVKECGPLPCVPKQICEHMVLAHSYVLWQCYTKAFCPDEALMKGTLFPELWGVYPIPQ